MRLRVGPGADVDAVATIACRIPGIVSFTYQPSTPSELFRQAVAP